MDDQTDIKFLKQEEFNANIVKRLEELEDKIPIIIQRIIGTEDFLLEQKEYIETAAVEANARFDIGIENRTIAFRQIAQLENEVEALQIWKYNIETKLERHDDILVVHSNQNDTQRKNHKQLIKVFDEKVIPLIEGTHGR
jgi:uncharacterized protein YecA (UPF0149 family)